MIRTFRTPIIMGLMLAMTSVGFAQTADELKAEREQLKTELKSKDAQKREGKIVALAEKAPSNTSVQSVDGLAEIATGVLGTVVSVNDLLSTFKREVTDNSNGEIDVTTHKAKLSDYTELATKLLGVGATIASGTDKVKGVQGDIKSLSPAQAMPATKSVKYSTEALKLSGEEVALQLKLVNNLIATLKSADNL